MRVVYDTNILISAIFSQRSSPFRCLQLAVDHRQAILQRSIEARTAFETGTAKVGTAEEAIADLFGDEECECDRQAGGEWGLQNGRINSD